MLELNFEKIKKISQNLENRIDRAGILQSKTLVFSVQKNNNLASSGSTSKTIRDQLLDITIQYMVYSII